MRKTQPAINVALSEMARAATRRTAGRVPLACQGGCEQGVLSAPTSIVRTTAGPTAVKERR